MPSVAWYKEDLSQCSGHQQVKVSLSAPLQPSDGRQHIKGMYTSTKGCVLGS